MHVLGFINLWKKNEEKGGHYKDLSLEFQFKDFLKFIKTISTSLLHILWGSSLDDVEEEVVFCNELFLWEQQRQKFCLGQSFEKQLNPGECARCEYKLVNKGVVKPSGSLMHKIVSFAKVKFSLLPFPLHSFYFLVFSHWSS